jgi:hypothetical protein
MKRTLLFIFTSLLLIIAAANYASAQQYKPTAVNGAHWIVIKTYAVSPNPVDGGIWDYYELAGFMRDDTTARKVYGIDWMTTDLDQCPNEHTLPPGSSSYVLHTNNYAPGIYFCGLLNQTTRSPLNKLVIIK